MGMRVEPGGQTLTDKERRRQVIEDALLAFRPELRETFGSVIRRDVLSPQDALANLEASDVVPLIKHRAVVDGYLRSRGRTRTDIRVPVNRVLRTTIPEDRTIPDTRLDDAVRVLDELTAAGDSRLQQSYWVKWVGATTDIFNFSTAEETFQACNDSGGAPKLTPKGEPTGTESRLIVADFWSDLPPSAFAPYVDPRNWPTYSTFWEEMTELPAGSFQAKVDPPKGYDCCFSETVKIFTERLTVPLQIAYRELPDQSRVWARFNISRGHYTSAVPVNVDTGTVSAESIPGGPAPTRVRATKYLHWSDSGRPDLTALACDLGWSELMAEMIYASLGKVPVPHNVVAADQAAMAGQTAETGKTTVDDAVGRFMDDVMREWKKSVNDYAPPLNHLVRRFTGSTWNLRWVNDLLDVGKVTADHSGNVASHVRRLADALQRADDGKDDDG